MPDFSKKIWIYWEQGFDGAPDLVNYCVRSWADKNPGWQVVLLDSKNLSRFACYEDLQREEIRKLGVQHRSDILRLGILQEYGGVWVDASTYCICSLDAWIHQEMSDTSVFMFSEPAVDKLVANWFIASNRNSYPISRLYASLKDYWIVNDFPRQGKLRRLLVKFVTRFLVPVLGKKIAYVWYGISASLKVYPYFIFHYIFSKLYFEDDVFQREWNRTPKHSATGPLMLKRLLASEQDRSTIPAKLAKSELPPLFKLSWRNEDALSVLYELQRVASFSNNR